jgi:hypothetical protein
MLTATKASNLKKPGMHADREGQRSFAGWRMNDSEVPVAILRVAIANVHFTGFVSKYGMV